MFGQANNYYKKNHGRPGVVYILKNEGLRPGLYKIGCSRRSGRIRASELNRDANTGTPSLYKCIFQYRTKDCGRAEELVHRQLASTRRGKWGQEFFEVTMEEAQRIIIDVATKINKSAKSQFWLPACPDILDLLEILASVLISTGSYRLGHLLLRILRSKG